MPKRNICLIPLCLILGWVMAACNHQPPWTDTPTIPAASPSPAPFTPTLTPTTIPSRTATSSPSATNTPSPSSTSTPVPTPTNTPTPSLTPTATSYPPIVHPNWTSYTNGNYIRALLVDRDGSLWSGGSGGVVHWNVATGDYVKYTTENGLANNWVTSIAQAADGAVWFGTSAGASRFKDGIWKTYTTRDGLKGDDIYDITLAPDGVLWFCTDKGVSRYDGETWTSFELDAWVIKAAPDGTLWGAGGNSLIHFDGNQWISYPGPFQCESQYVCNNRDVNALAIAPDGAVWVGTATTLYRFDGKKWIGYNPWRAYTYVGVSALLFAPNGELWIGLGYYGYGYSYREAGAISALTPGVYRFDGYNWKLITEQDGLVSNEIQAITQGPDGSFYFGSNAAGISRFDGQKWTIFQTQNEPLSNFINRLDVSKTGIVWLAHPQGVSRFDGHTWSTYTQFSNLSTDIDAICVAPDETVWVSMYNGVAHFDGQNWVTYLDKKYPWASYIRTITAWPDGKLFFGRFNGAVIYDGQNWNEITWLSQESIDVALALQNGTLWAYGSGLPGGIYFYDGKTWFNKGHAYSDIGSIAVKTDGTVWFGAARLDGVLVYDGKKWVTYTPKDRLASEYVRSIVAGSDGTIWFGTGNGLSRFDGSDWETFTTQDGLANNIIQDMRMGTSGALWIATYAGLTRYMPSSGDLPAITKTPTPTQTFFMTSTPTPIRTPHLAEIEDASGSKMSLVAAGSFVMGHNDDYSYGESPEHTVYLYDFYIDRYEVTNLQFSTFLNAKGNQSEGWTTWLDTHTYLLGLYYLGGGKWQPVDGSENLPVVGATWFGAKAYCEWRGSRLPTEAEWEKAARGRLARKLFPWGDSNPVCDQHAMNGANYEGFDVKGDCSRIHPVGDFLPNGYGLYDIAGNVAEWVADWYSYDYYATLPPGVDNPQGPDTGTYRVVRGGSWQNIFDSLRVFDRSWNSPESGSSDIGFRCVSQP